MLLVEHTTLHTQAFARDKSTMHPVHTHNMAFMRCVYACNSRETGERACGVYMCKHAHAFMCVLAMCAHKWTTRHRPGPKPGRSYAHIRMRDDGPATATVLFRAHSIRFEYEHTHTPNKLYESRAPLAVNLRTRGSTATVRCDCIARGRAVVAPQWQYIIVASRHSAC